MSPAFPIHTFLYPFLYRGIMREGRREERAKDHVDVDADAVCSTKSRTEGGRGGDRCRSGSKGGVTVGYVWYVICVM